VADKKTPAVPPIPVPPVEPAPKAAKAPAKAPAAAKPPAATKASAAAKPIPPLVDLAGTKSAPAAAQPNPYAPAAPAAAQPNPYAASAPPQPYNYGPYVPQPPQGLSIVSMVLGIVGLLLSFGGAGFLLNVAAVITGHMATRRQPYAKGFWLTGIVTGYVGLAFSLLWGIGILLWIIFAVGIGTTSFYDYGY